MSRLAALLLVANLGLVAAGCKHDEEKRAFQLRVAIPSEGAPFASALRQALGVELRPGHAVTLLSNGAVFDGLDEEIRKAPHTRPVTR